MSLELENLKSKSDNAKQKLMTSAREVLKLELQVFVENFDKLTESELITSIEKIYNYKEYFSAK
ncbi:hypothetical protein ACWATR_18395 [Nostoc sp. UIC 10890]